MANINWDNLEEQMGSKYKSFAEEGKHTVKCVDVEIKTTSTGSVVEKFIFAEGEDCQYPTADHWISKKNDNFRAYHQKNLLVALGASEANARLAVEKAESKDDFDYAVKAYETAFKSLLKKEPLVEIEVYTARANNGKEYARAEFTNKSVAMPHDNASSNNSNSAASVIDGGEEIDLSEIPF